MLEELENEEEGSTGQGGKDGTTGARYHDPFAVPSRDDLLPLVEIKRLLSVHETLQKAHVDKQKNTRKERATLKEGKTPSYSMPHAGQGGGGRGVRSHYKTHWISQTAQFSQGMDKQVVMVHDKMEAVTNEALQNTLQNKLTLENRPRYTPTFNPRPRGPLGG